MKIIKKEVMKNMIEGPVFISESPQPSSKKKVSGKKIEADDFNIEKIEED